MTLASPQNLQAFRASQRQLIEGNLQQLKELTRRCRLGAGDEDEDDRAMDQKREDGDLEVS